MYKTYFSTPDSGSWNNCHVADTEVIDSEQVASNSSQAVKYKIQSYTCIFKSVTRNHVHSLKKRQSNCYHFSSFNFNKVWI
jgi:hypothetical protein